jgi:hypothetical protein
MSLTGYLNEQNIDLIYVFESQSDTQSATNITSGPSGLQISVLAGNTGPLNFQTNGTGATSQNINITSSGNIYLSPTQTPSISITNFGLTLSPNGTTSLTTNTAGTITCFNQWYYGVRVIANTITTAQTYALSLTDPRNIFFTGTQACNLVFPATPPNGTEYFIRKTTGSYTITATTNATLRSNNSVQTTFGTTTKNSGVVYSTYVSKWICFNISN